MPWQGPSERDAASLVPFRPLPAQGPVFPALPHSFTTLVGWEAETAAVVALLRGADTRLVTLAGPGGVGKTRLALRVAESLPNDFPDGRAVISLAAIRDADRVLPEIARALAMRAEDADEALDRLTHAFRHRLALLVLDNLEQIPRAGIPLLHLLASCPTLSILVTSRGRLRVAGEQVVTVPPLALPEESASARDALATADAVRLFTARAQAVMAEFTLSDQNAAAVAAICRRLDGLPLAIELAAARVQVLPPHALLARLEQHLPVLTSGLLNVPDRQRTLRDTIAWSFALLAPPEQRLLMRLALFDGGVGLRGAAAVADESDLTSGHASPAVTILDQVSLLVEQSLLAADQENTLDGEPRFVMLQTIREGVLELLEQSGTAQVARRRHAEFFCLLAAEAAPELHGPRQRDWLDRLERDVANFRAALNWAITAGDAALSLTLANNLFMFWLKRGHIAEGRAWCERALALPDAGSVPERLGALIAMAGLAGPTGDLPRAREALALARERAETRVEGRALHLLGGPAIYSRPAEAIDFFGQAVVLHATAAESLELALGLGDGIVANEALVGIAGVLGASHQAQEAAQVFAAAEGLREAMGISLGHLMIPDQYERDLRATREALGEEAFAAAWVDGRTISPDRLLDVVRTIASSPASRALPGCRHDRDHQALLTARELDVLRLLAEGRSNAEIAQILFIGTRTVEFHVANILGKLGASNRRDATAIAARHGLL